MTTRALVTPRCCAAAKQNPAVILSIDWVDSDIHGKTSADIEPEWVVQVFNIDEYPPHQPAAPTHCPFCGTKLPKPVRRKDPPKVSVISDGGNYCDTCARRLSACNCPYPEQAWEPGSGT